jgi:hypothetical protein
VALDWTLDLFFKKDFVQYLHAPPVPAGAAHSRPIGETPRHARPAPNLIRLPRNPHEPSGRLPPRTTDQGGTTPRRGPQPALKNWKRWGPYLSERQWATVREDYSAGWLLLGLFSARPRPQPRLSLGRGRPARHHRPRMPALFRARALERPRSDSEGAALRPDRPGGQSRRGREGAIFLSRFHADAFVDAGALQIPAGRVSLRAAAGREPPPRPGQPEFELADTGIFDDGRYFDVFAEYAKAAPDHMLIRITVANRGPEAGHPSPAADPLVPQPWTWGCTREGCAVKPRAQAHRRRSMRPITKRWALFAGVGPVLRRKQPRPVHGERDNTQAGSGAHPTYRRT